MLTPEQTQLLKLIGIKMVTFKVGLRARWEAESGEVVQVDGEAVEADAAPSEEVEKAEADSAEVQMSE